jgi:hypothetical protein
VVFAIREELEQSGCSSYSRREDIDRRERHGSRGRLAEPTTARGKGQISDAEAEILRV